MVMVTSVALCDLHILACRWVLCLLREAAERALPQPGSHPVMQLHLTLLQSMPQVSCMHLVRPRLQMTPRQGRMGTAAPHPRVGSRQRLIQQRAGTSQPAEAAGGAEGRGFRCVCTRQHASHQFACGPQCSLRPLLVALNDEDVRVRGLAIDMAGRLAGCNPAVVLPALRRHLMQLLADLEHSPDSRQREGAQLQ